MKPIYLTDSNFDRLKAWCDETGHGTNSILEAALNALDALQEFQNEKEKTAKGRIDLRGEDPA